MLKFISGFNNKKLVFYLIFIFIFLLFLQPINSGDFFHHLNTGKYILQHFKLPYYDTLSFTAYNKPWVAHSWGSGVILYIIFSLFGGTGISIFFAFIGLCTIIVLFLILRTFKLSDTLAISIVFLTASVTSFYWPLRPEVFVGLLVLGLIYLLTKYQFSFRLIPYFFIWGILYGSSAFLGIGLLLWYLVCYKLGTKKTAVILFSSFIASLLNGYGLKSFLYIFQISAIAPHTGEWLPLFKTIDPSFPDIALAYQYTAFLYLLFNIIFIFTLIFGLIQKNKLKQTNLFYIIFSVVIFAPFFSIRFISMAAFCAAPSLIILNSKLTRKSRIFITAIFIVIAIITSLMRFKTEPFKTGISSDVFPYKVINYFTLHHLNGNIFTNQEIGAFFSWSLPDSKVFFDTRDDLYQPLGIFRKLTNIRQGNLHPHQLFDEYKVNIAVIDSSEGYLFQELLYNPDWKLVYITDGYFVIVRNNLIKSNNLVYLSALDPTLDPPSRPKLIKQAIKEMKNLIDQDRSSMENKVRLIELELANNNSSDAEKTFNSLKQDNFLNSGNAENRVLANEIAGQVYLVNNTCDKALSFFKRADLLSRNQFIFFPSKQLPNSVNLFYGDYYYNCEHNSKKAKEYYFKYLRTITNPIQQIKFMQKINSLIP